MDKETEKARLTVNINKELIKEFKLLAVEKNKTLGYFVEKGLKTILEDEKKEGNKK